MFNKIIAITLSILVLIAQNIILLNEESLILICFISFCFLCVRNISESIITEFDNRSLIIKETIKKSLNHIFIVLNDMFSTKNRSWNLFNSFKRLESKHLNSINIIFDWSTQNLIENTKIPFLKRLQFIRRLESQTTQLIPLLIIRKLQNIIFLKHFCCLDLNNPHFLCLKKVNTREYIQSIIGN